MRDHPIIALTFLSALAWQHSCAAPGWAQPSEGPTSDTRTLRFPTNRSLGLLIGRERGEKDERAWREIGDARGEVQVGIDLEVGLRIPALVARDLSPLAELDPNALTEINLTYSDLPAGQLIHLGGLSSLERLYLRGTSVDESGLEQLDGLTSLRILDLALTKISNDALAPLARLPALEEINLHQTYITDEGLAHLKNVKSLRRLYLWYSAVGDAGLVHLKDLQMLEALDFPSAITDAGLVHLQRIQTLQELYFYDNDLITDEGVKRLSELRRLRILYLRSERVTDASLVHLKRLNTLETLFLVDTQITAEGFAALKQALGECKVYW